jgi:WD40 repeat protein
MGRWVEALAFSPDSTTLWAATEDMVGSMTGETHAWTVAPGTTGTTVASVDGPSWTVALDAAGANVLIGAAAVSVVQSSTGKVVRTIGGAAGAAAFSHDGKWIAAVAGPSDAAIAGVNIYLASDSSLVANVPHPVAMNERIWRVAFSPDDSLLLTASGQNGLGSPHGATYLWSTKDWSKTAELTCTTFDAAFSPDGSTLALACWTSAELVNVASQMVTHVLHLPNGGEAMGVAFSPDGTKVAVGAFQGNVPVFAASDGSLLTTLKDGSTPHTIKAVAYSPDGKTIAGGGWDGDGVVHLWSSP